MNAQIPKISMSAFTIKAIKTLRGKRAGICINTCGFNEAFRKYFGNYQDPEQAIKRLSEAKYIETSQCKRGTMIYLMGEKPKQTSKPSANVILRKLGL